MVKQVSDSVQSSNAFKFNYTDYLESRRRRELLKGWAGASIQHISVDYMRPIAGQDIELPKADYCRLLETLIGRVPETQPWVIQHENPQYPWLPAHLPEMDKSAELQSFFNRHGLDPLFVGGIQMDAKQLVGILPDLMQYPSIHKYQDLVILNEAQEVIIKIVHHFTVDLITDNEDSLLHALKELPLDHFRIVRYRQPNG